MTNSIELIRWNLEKADDVSKGESEAIETLIHICGAGWVHPDDVHTIAERVLVKHGLIERDDDEFGWWATELGCLVELACVSAGH